LAEVFKFTLGKEPFLGPVVCRLELSSPTEESTDGGRLAVQHVSIVPEGGGPTVVIGTAFQIDRLAEVRQYETVADTYKKRFRTSTFPVSPGQFDEMTRKLKAFFQQFGFKFEVAPLQQPSPVARASAAAPRQPTMSPGAAGPGSQGTIPPGGRQAAAQPGAPPPGRQPTVRPGAPAPGRQPTVPPAGGSARQATLPPGSAARTATRPPAPVPAPEEDDDLRPAGTQRTWVLMVIVALVAASLAGAAAYFLRG
jgi:hypothetical protein